jgi:hypothetical protein
VRSVGGVVNTSHPDGIFGVFPDDYAALLSVVKSINARARVT